MCIRDSAKEEGIIFKLLNNPVEILGDENEFVTGMKCVEMELGEPDESGRSCLLYTSEPEARQWI